MHKDVEKVHYSQVVRPVGEIFVVYFSSISNNTHRFIEKLGVKSTRIPYSLDEEITVSQDYVLVCPTYSGGGEFTSGAVPKQVIKFLNKEQNRKHCRGIIASGNTNFGDTFALAGPVLSKKLNVPLLYQFELLGTSNDIQKITKIFNEFWINN